MGLNSHHVLGRGKPNPPPEKLRKETGGESSRSTSEPPTTKRAEVSPQPEMPLMVSEAKPPEIDAPVLMT